MPRAERESYRRWVKAAYIAFTALTFLWAIREGLLWIMNMLWPMTSIMAPNARRHHQRFESIIENVSVPLWDAVMARWWGAYRGRYLRQRDADDGSRVYRRDLEDP